MNSLILMGVGIKDYLFDRRNWFFFSLAIAFALIFGGHRFTNMMDDWVGMENYMTHNFPRPFVTRALIPVIVKFVTSFKGSPEMFFQVFEILGMFVSVLLFERLLTIFINNKTFTRFSSLLLPLIASLYWLIPRNLNLWYPYDVWALVFFLAMLICLLNENYVVYYVLFVLAVINRESVFFITFAQISLYFGSYSRKKMAVHVFSQFVLWVALVLMLEKIFANGIVPYYENTILKNWNWIYAILTASGVNNGSYAKSLFNLVLWVMELSYFFSTVYVIKNWKELTDIRLKRLFLVLVPFYIVVFLRTNSYEYRLLGEMLPFAVLPALFLLYKKIKIEAL